MTGKGIMEALSFVDEKYIEEAESENLRRKQPIVKVILPLAACLCVAFLGLFLRSQGNPTEELAPQEQIAEIGILETIVQDRTESALYGQNDIAMDVKAPETPENCNIFSGVLRIVQWTEGGFSATVEKSVDSEIFPAGTLLNVTFQENICVESYSGDLVTVERRLPTETDFPAGTLIRVRFYRISGEDTTICIDTIALEEE